MGKTFEAYKRTTTHRWAASFQEDRDDFRTDDEECHRAATSLLKRSHTCHQLTHRSRIKSTFLLAALIILLNNCCSASQLGEAEDSELSKTLDNGSDEEMNLSLLTGGPPFSTIQMNRDRADSRGFKIPEEEFAGIAESSDQVETHQYISVLNNQSNIVLSEHNGTRTNQAFESPHEQQVTVGRTDLNLQPTLRPQDRVETSSDPSGADLLTSEASGGNGTTLLLRDDHTGVKHGVTRSSGARDRKKNDAATSDRRLKIKQKPDQWIETDPTKAHKKSKKLKRNRPMANRTEPTQVHKTTTTAAKDEHLKSKMISYSAVSLRNRVITGREASREQRQSPLGDGKHQVRAEFGGRHLVTREQPLSNASLPPGQSPSSQLVPSENQLHHQQDLVSQNSQLDLTSTKGPFELDQSLATRQPSEYLATASSLQSGSNELDTTLKQHQREPIEAETSAAEAESPTTSSSPSVESTGNDDDYNSADSESDSNGDSDQHQDLKQTGESHNESGKARLNKGSSKQVSGEQVPANASKAKRQELLVGPFRSEAEAPATITLSGVIYQKSGSSAPLFRSTGRSPADSLAVSSTLSQTDNSEPKQQQVLLGDALEQAKQQYWPIGVQLQPSSRLVGFKNAELSSSGLTSSQQSDKLTGISGDEVSPYAIGGGLRLSPMSLLSGLTATAASNVDDLSLLEPPKQILTASPAALASKPVELSKQQVSLLSAAASLDQVPIWAKKNQEQYYLAQPSTALLADASESSSASSGSSTGGQVALPGQRELEAAQSQMSKHNGKHHPIVIVQKDVKPVKYHLLRAYLKLRRLLRPFEATYIFANDPHAGLFKRLSSRASVFGPAHAPPGEAVAH